MRHFSTEKNPHFHFLCCSSQRSLKQVSSSRRIQMSPKPERFYRHSLHTITTSLTLLSASAMWLLKANEQPWGTVWVHASFRWTRFTRLPQRSHSPDARHSPVLWNIRHRGNRWGQPFAPGGCDHIFSFVDFLAVIFFLVAQWKICGFIFPMCL